MPMLRLDTRHDDDDDDDDDHDDDDDDDDDGADAILAASPCVQARYHQPCAEASLQRSLDRPSLPILLLPPQLLLMIAGPLFKWHTRRVILNKNLNNIFFCFLQPAVHRVILPGQSWSHVTNDDDSRFRPVC